jgi:hypothetical protein
MFNSVDLVKIPTTCTQEDMTVYSVLLLKGAPKPCPYTLRRNDTIDPLSWGFPCFCLFPFLNSEFWWKKPCSLSTYLMTHTHPKTDRQTQFKNVLVLIWSRIFMSNRKAKTKREKNKN